MSIEQWFFILSGFVIGIITCATYYKFRNIKVSTPSTPTNSESVEIHWVTQSGGEIF